MRAILTVLLYSIAFQALAQRTTHIAVAPLVEWTPETIAYRDAQITEKGKFLRQCGKYLYIFKPHGKTRDEVVFGHAYFGEKPIIVRGSLEERQISITDGLNHKGTVMRYKMPGDSTFRYDVILPEQEFGLVAKCLGRKPTYM